MSGRDMFTSRTLPQSRYQGPLGHHHHGPLAGRCCVARWGHFCFASVQGSVNTVSEKRKGKGNSGPSAALIGGTFTTGGELYANNQPVGSKGRIPLFDGRDDHFSTPFAGGERVSLIFFTHSRHTEVPTADLEWLREAGFPLAAAPAAASASSKPDESRETAPPIPRLWRPLRVRRPDHLRGCQACRRGTNPPPKVLPVPRGRDRGSGGRCARAGQTRFPASLQLRPTNRRVGRGRPLRSRRPDPPFNRHHRSMHQLGSGFEI